MNRLLLGAPLKGLLLRSGLGRLGLLVFRFRRESPRDQQQLWKQAAKKQQEDHYALRCLVLDS